MQGQGTDWAALIGTANQAALAWYTATRPTYGPVTGVTIAHQPGSISASASMPLILILVAAVVVVIVVTR